MATKKMEEKMVKITMPTIKMAKITIVGETDLCLNKMSLGNRRKLPQFSSGKVKPKTNKFGDLITALHWETDIDEEAIYDDATYNDLMTLLATNKPCISGFGLKKSFGDAVVRNNISQYKTSFMDTVNVLEDKIPVNYANYIIREFIPKVGKARMVTWANQFSGWSATFTIKFTETAYSFDSILSIIEIAGFGGGIGSGTTSGLGRYHIGNVEEL